MRGQREDSYSVRLPTGSTHVGSSRVRQMLSVLFAQRVPLVEDPGPGEVYLKLTLPTAQVHALQALAGGDTACVALRRLVATFAGGSLPVRWPAPVLAPASFRDDSQALAVSKPHSRFPGDPPAWCAMTPEQWARADREWKKYVSGITPTVSAVDAATKQPTPKSTLSSLWTVLRDPGISGLLLYFGLILLCAWIFGSGGTSSAAGATGSRPAVPPFPQWRPR